MGRSGDGRQIRSGLRTACVEGMCEREGGMSACVVSTKPMRCWSRCSTVWRRMRPCSSKGSALSKAFFTSGVTGKAWCEQHRSVSTTCRTCAHMPPARVSRLLTSFRGSVNA